MKNRGGGSVVRATLPITAVAAAACAACASILGYDRATLDDVVDAAAEGGARLDTGADAPLDAGCVVRFTDDFNRAAPGGAPWRELVDMPGDGGYAKIIDAGPDASAFALFFPSAVGADAKNRQLDLDFALADDTTFAEVTFDQFLLIGNTNVGDWSATLAAFSVVEDASVALVGAQVVNGAGVIGGFRLAEDGGTLDLVPIPAPFFSAGPDAGLTHLRLTVTFGPSGSVTLVADNIARAGVAFPTGAGTKLFSLGLFAPGATPDIAVAYRNVQLCTR